jgi:translation initiation factor IF-3
MSAPVPTSSLLATGSVIFCRLPFRRFCLFYKIRRRDTGPVVIFSRSHAIDTSQPMTTLRSRHTYSCAVSGGIVRVNQETKAIRRPFRAPPTVNEGPRANQNIRAASVQLIDAEGQNHGVLPTEQALAMAEEAGLDLVEINSNGDVPVCKIVDLGKLKYASQKKASEARKKQKTVEVKEIKMRPNIDTHDYDVKMRAMNRFFDEGDKVKVTLRFRGREMAHMELGMKLLQKVKDDTIEIAKVEAEPKLEGRQMMMVLAPK